MCFDDAVVAGIFDSDSDFVVGYQVFAMVFSVASIQS